MPALQWIIVRYKSMPAIVVRAMVGTLLSTGDQLSDVGSDGHAGDTWSGQLGR